MGNGRILVINIVLQKDNINFIYAEIVFTPYLKLKTEKCVAVSPTSRHFWGEVRFCI